MDIASEPAKYIIKNYKEQQKQAKKQTLNQVDEEQDCLGEDDDLDDFIDYKADKKDKNNKKVRYNRYQDEEEELNKKSGKFSGNLMSAIANIKVSSLM